MIQKHKYLFLTCSLILLTVASYNGMSNTIDPIPSEAITYHEVNFIDPPYGSPIKTQDISSGFGQRMHPIKKVLKLHKGVDFKAKLGTDVFTVEAGVVTDTGFDKKFGNYVEIKHDDVFSTRYHHLQTTTVKKNQKVDKNTKIGEVGSTGFSTGPHLHYEIIKEGKNVDPATYLKA